MKMTAFRVLQVQGPKFHAGSLELHIEYTALFALSAIYEGESGKCLYERGKKHLSEFNSYLSSNAMVIHNPGPIMMDQEVLTLELKQ